MTLCYVITLLVVLGAGEGALVSVCHNNTAGLTSQQVVQNIAGCFDRDNNSVIRPTEVPLCFTHLMDITLPFSENTLLSMTYETLLVFASFLGDSIRVPRHRFVRVWSARFKDSPAFAEAFFDAFDENKDGFWDVDELDNIVQTVMKGAAGEDNKLTKQEFTAYFLREVYGADCNTGHSSSE